jgi:hypothetical protein
MDDLAVYKSHCLTLVVDPKSQKLRLFAGADEIYTLGRLKLVLKDGDLDLDITLKSDNKYAFKEDSDKLKSII